MEPTKRITRSRTDRMIAGVAGGLASYLGVDPLIVRIAFIVLTLLNGFGVMLYIVMWLLVPNEDAIVDSRDNLQVAIGEMQDMVEQLVNRIRAAFQR